MSKPIKLEPCNLREVWDKIKPGLEAVKAEWPEVSTWRVEDVYAAVLAEQAVIYDTEDGFAICNIRTDRYTGQTDLLIWIAYAYENKRGGVMQKYLPSFIEVAKDLGCSRVVTLSNHPALASILEPVYTLYGVEV
jgi:hypothetical protein